MIRPVAAYIAKFDLVYRDRSYFAGVKARLLVAFNWFILLFIPLNVAKLLWVQPPELPIRLMFNMCWGIAALLSLRWLRQGHLQKAGNGLVLGSIIPVHASMLLLVNYPEPVGAAFQLFIFDFVILLLALVFASRRISYGVLAAIVVTHVCVYARGVNTQPMSGSLQYAADLLLRDGLIAVGFVFCFGALLVSMIESGHLRSEEALRATRAVNDNLGRLVEERTRDLKAASALANEAAKAKGDFLANMSHEIRTPLNGIIATADLLRRRTDLSDEAAGQVRLIENSGELLLKLIGDILDISKIEAGRLVLESHPFVLASLVADTTALLATTAARGGVKFECTVTGGLDRSFSGDSFRLRQVLLNLGSNAIKFTPAGGSVQLVITSADPQADPARVGFEVRDTGIGMDAETMKRIFERFTQADSSTTRRYGGSGLGLAISSRIVEAMGGELRVESAPGRGSRFFFTLPFHPARLSSVSAVVSAETLVGLGLRVVVVEDNAMNRKILGVQLEQLGCCCTMAVDGANALQVLQEEPLPDVVLMDCHMPGIDGWEATRRIRAWASDPEATSVQRKAAVLPVIALTAAALPEERTRCMDAGMDDFLSKPAKLADLQGALRPFARPAGGKLPVGGEGTGENL